MDNIYIGNVLPSHTADEIKDFIHTHAKIDKELIKIQELSQNQVHPRSRAFKVSVPKGKLQDCLKLPWGTTVKAQPFRPKSKGTAVGTTGRQGFVPPTRRPQTSRAPPGNFNVNGMRPYWDHQSPEYWNDWGYPYNY